MWLREGEEDDEETVEGGGWVTDLAIEAAVG